MLAVLTESHSTEIQFASRTPLLHLAKKDLNVRYRIDVGRCDTREREVRE